MRLFVFCITLTHLEQKLKIKLDKTHGAKLDNNWNPIEIIIWFLSTLFLIIYIDCNNRDLLFFIFKDLIILKEEYYFEFKLSEISQE